MTDGAVHGIEIVDSGSAQGTRTMPDDVVFRQRGRTRNARHKNTVSSGPASVILAELTLAAVAGCPCRHTARVIRQCQKVLKAKEGCGDPASYVIGCTAPIALVRNNNRQRARTAQRV